MQALVIMINCIFILIIDIPYYFGYSNSEKINFCKKTGYSAMLNNTKIFKFYLGEK